MNNTEFQTPATEQQDADVERLSSLLAAARVAMKGGTRTDLVELNRLTEEIAAPRSPRMLVASVNVLLEIALWNFYSTAEPRNGVIAANYAVELARQTDDNKLLRRALTMKGFICADTADIGMGIECHSESLQLLPLIGDPQADYSVWNNLGVAYMYASLYQVALQCFTRAVEIAVEHEMPNIPYAQHDAWSNIGLCFLHLEDFESGIEAMQKCRSSVGEPKTPTELLARTNAEYHHTRLLLSLNRVAEAKIQASLAKRFAELASMPRATVAAENAEGLVEVFTGNGDIGMTRLSASLERAKTLKSGYRDTLLALVMAHERAGDNDRAAEYQGQLMQATWRAQQDNALFHNHLHQAKLRYVGHQEKQIGVVQDRHLEVLKRKSVEVVRLKERIEMFERLAVTAELRDDETGKHSFRVGKLCALLARELGCEKSLCAHIELAGRLHDIGKMSVPDSILLKPGPLTPQERQIMETHTTAGAELLSKSQMEELQVAEQIARHHHEWWDGNGYPFRLRGEEIPLQARIAAVVDVFDALTHARVYKRAWSIQEALAEILNKRGTHFDPRVVDHFVPLIHRLVRNWEDKPGGLDDFLGQAALESRYQQSRELIDDALRRRHGGTAIAPVVSS
jgi:putative two-component system response regulator